MTKVVSVPNLHVKTVDDKVLVHDPNRDKVHVLNATAGRVLALCDGTRDIAEISREFAAGADVAEDVAQRDAAALVAEFTRLGLVAEA